jgi:hypothetical protein
LSDAGAQIRSSSRSTARSTCLQSSGMGRAGARCACRGLLQAVTLLCDDAADAIVWRAGRPGLWQRLAGSFARHDLPALLDVADRDR